MNAELLNELADYIEAHKEIPFDLASVEVAKNCGTPACIGGFGTALWPHTCLSSGAMNMVNVSNHLGLRWTTEGYILMTFRTVKNIAPKDADGWQNDENYVAPNREDAVAALRALANGSICPAEFRWDNFIDARRDLGINNV